MLIYLSVLETDHEKHEFMALYAEYHAVMLRVAKNTSPPIKWHVKMPFRTHG